MKICNSSAGDGKSLFRNFSSLLSHCMAPVSDSKTIKSMPCLEGHRCESSSYMLTWNEQDIKELSQRLCTNGWQRLVTMAWITNVNAWYHDGAHEFVQERLATLGYQRWASLGRIGIIFASQGSDPLLSSPPRRTSLRQVFKNLVILWLTSPTSYM